MATATLPQPTLLLTIEQAARQLQVSPRTLSRMEARGEVPAVRFGPRIVRFRTGTIERLVREHEQECMVE
jgi:excisionase family DNA binding protein